MVFIANGVSLGECVVVRQIIPRIILQCSWRLFGRNPLVPFAAVPTKNRTGFAMIDILKALFGHVVGGVIIPAPILEKHVGTVRKNQSIGIAKTAHAMQ